MKAIIRLQLSFAGIVILTLSCFGQVISTNATIRVMASNLSSGNLQRYETAGLNILKGLKPDVVAMQEFNYSSATQGLNTDAALREMVDNNFGTNFVYFRQTGVNIPNGVISRYPILNSGVWDDTTLGDRDFVWVELDIPGSNSLYVVSVHLKASSGSASQRAGQATTLKGLITANFPVNAFIVVAGDMNIASTSEACLATFKTFLSDSPIPTDATSGGSANTNEPRSERYDYVFPNPSLDSNRVTTVVGTHNFVNGLVFDSAVYSPLSEVSPVQSGDSHVTGMQHMGVVRDFKISYTITNLVSVPSPAMGFVSTNILRWTGPSNVTYSVQASTNLPVWFSAGTSSSTTTNYAFTNGPSANTQRYYRLVYP